jgi:D-tyrosyl-tRNA(Tyr) deacylase
MKAVIQRVSQAKLYIEGSEKAAIGRGLVVLLGIADDDGPEDISWLAEKIVNLRIFSDADGKMNCSALEVKGEFLVVSQFTLHAKTKKGNRPSFIHAARPEVAVPLYEMFLQSLTSLAPGKVKCGVFAANMQVQLTNDGPVTIVIDTKSKE